MEPDKQLLMRVGGKLGRGTHAETPSTGHRHPAVIGYKSIDAHLS